MHRLPGPGCLSLGVALHATFAEIALELFDAGRETRAEYALRLRGPR